MAGCVNTDGPASLEWLASITTSDLHHLRTGYPPNLSKLHLRDVSVNSSICYRYTELSPESLGFLAINNADSAWTTTFKTSLAAGSYCDVISGSNSGGSCTGTG